MAGKMNTIVFERETSEWEKDNKKLEEQKVKEETKKELSEFDILKEATKEFDVFKDKISSLNLPDEIKVKIMNDATLLFYSKDNDLNKLKWIKYLNGLIDTINENKDDLSSMKEKIKSYINDSMEDGISIDWYLAFWSIIAVFVFVLWSVGGIFSSWVGITLWIITVAWILNDAIILYNWNELVSKNKLFDILNDIYPQITEEEFNKIYDLYDDKKFDMLKFTKMMEEYEKDGKITLEERKKIDEFILKPSR